jgi:2'-5' RNA ligase
VAQSIELILDPVAEAAVIAQWQALATAGLPSSLRPEPSPHHRPHLTLYAADALPDAVEDRLPSVVGDVDLHVRVGSLMIFGPRRGSCVLTRQVLPSMELLELQARVAELCRAERAGSFGPGRWSPHVTLARRLPTGQLGAAVAAVAAVAASGGELNSRVRQCRRWDGHRRTAWWVSNGDRA